MLKDVPGGLTHRDISPESVQHYHDPQTGKDRGVLIDHDVFRESQQLENWVPRGAEITARDREGKSRDSGTSE